MCLVEEMHNEDVERNKMHFFRWLGFFASEVWESLRCTYNARLYGEFCCYAAAVHVFPTKLALSLSAFLIDPTWTRERVESC